MNSKKECVDYVIKDQSEVVKIIEHVDYHKCADIMKSDED